MESTQSRVPWNLLSYLAISIQGEPHLPRPLTGSLGGSGPFSSGVPWPLAFGGRSLLEHFSGPPSPRSLPPTPSAPSSSDALLHAFGLRRKPAPLGEVLPDPRENNRHLSPAIDQGGGLWIFPGRKVAWFAAYYHDSCEFQKSLILRSDKGGGFWNNLKC